MSEIWDLAICGAGPGGVMAAMEITRLTGLKVLMLEKMKRLHDSREVANGFMGGSSRSDVKLFLTPGFGGRISNPHIIPEMLEILEQFSRHRIKPSKAALTAKQLEGLQQHGVEVDEPLTAVMNSEVFTAMEKAMYQHLLKKLEFRSNCSLERLERGPGGFMLTTSGGKFFARHCILSMGRGGAAWLAGGGVGKQLEWDNDTYDLGVRLEFPHSVLRDLTEKSTNFRLRFGDYRTSAISSCGTVELENVYEIKTSNGRTMTGKNTGYSSFALLKTVQQTDAQARMLNSVQIVNILADDQLLREPLGRFLSGASQLCHLPEFEGLREGLVKVLEIWPQLRGRCTLYAPEARLNSLNLRLSSHFETSLRDLYVCGDQSGHTKSFIQAGCSGLLASRHIAAKLNPIVAH